jgi:hypothetical protein
LHAHFSCKLHLNITSVQINSMIITLMLHVIGTICSTSLICHIMFLFLWKFGVFELRIVTLFK